MNQPASRFTGQSAGQSAMQLKRIRYVTQNYRNLQGLKFVLFSLECLIGSSALIGFYNLTFMQSEILLPLFAILGYSVISFWYDYRFGRTGEKALQGLWHSAKRTLIHLLVGAFLFAGMWFVLSLAVTVDFLQPWVSVRGFAIAAMYFLFRYYLAGRRLYHLLAFGVLFTMSLLPLVGIQDAQIRWFTQGYWLFTLGVLLLLTSLIDHFILTRTLKPIPREEVHREHAL